MQGLPCKFINFNLLIIIKTLEIDKLNLLSQQLLYFYQFIKWYYLFEQKHRNFFIIIYQKGAMGQIDFTNIIVDDFRKGKLNPFNKYIYILTHIHSDHLRGLSNSWDYGPIYCSQITANLILNKFPNLKNCIRVISLQQPYKLKLADNIQATITFFDANHCAGAVMVLFQGYFGRFLYTGDFRFDRKKFRSYSYLYPPQNSNEKFEACSRPIDKMWLDNTFCNPRFKFMNQTEASEIVLDFVKQNIDQHRIYVGMDYYGKQEMLIHIAKQLDTIIVVDEQRYQNLIAMQFDRELFTTNPQEGRIQVVQKPKLHDKLRQNPDSIGLIMSGWCLQRQWRKLRGTDQNRIYYVPYSLHSNYQQIVSFVKSIKPSIIQPIVSLRQSSQGSSITSDSMYNTQGNQQTFHKIVKNHTSPLSPNFNKNLNDNQFHQALKRRFGLDRKSPQINKVQLNLNTVHVFPKGKGYKINRERDQQQISQVKEQYRKSKMIRNRVQQIVINDESQRDSEIQVIQKNQVEKNDKKVSYKANGIKLDWKRINGYQFMKGQKDFEEDFANRINQIIQNNK